MFVKLQECDVVMFFFAITHARRVVVNRWLHQVTRPSRYSYRLDRQIDILDRQIEYIYISRSIDRMYIYLDRQIFQIDSLSRYIGYLDILGIQIDIQICIVYPLDWRILLESVVQSFQTFQMIVPFQSLSKEVVIMNTFGKPHSLLRVAKKMSSQD